MRSSASRSKATRIGKFCLTQRRLIISGTCFKIKIFRAGYYFKIKKWEIKKPEPPELARLLRVCMLDFS